MVEAAALEERDLERVAAVRSVVGVGHEPPWRGLAQQAGEPPPAEGGAGDKHGGPGEADHSCLDVVGEQLDRQRVRAPALSLRGQGVGIRCAAFDPLGELTFGAKVLQVDT